MSPSQNRALSDRKLAKIALRYYNDGRYDKALEFYDKAIEMNSSPVQYYRGRAKCYWAVNNFTKTINDLWVVLRKEPNDQKSRGLLSHALLQTGDVEEAVKNILVLDTNEIKPFAKTLVYEKKIAEAIRCYDKVIEKEPDFVWNYGERGYCHLAIGEYDEAIKDFQTALSKAQTNDEYYRCSLAEAYFVAGRFEDAKNEITEFDDYHLSTLAKNLMKRGKYEEAVVCYTKIIEKDPSDLSVCCKRARCFEKAGKLKDAVFDYKQCSLVPFEQKEHKLKLGELLVVTGQYEDAKNVLLGIDEDDLREPDRQRLRKALRLLLIQDGPTEQPVRAPSVMENGSIDGNGLSELDRQRVREGLRMLLQDESRVHTERQITAPPVMVNG